MTCFKKKIKKKINKRYVPTLTNFFQGVFLNKPLVLGLTSHWTLEFEFEAFTFKVWYMDMSALRMFDHKDFHICAFFLR